MLYAIDKLLGQFKYPPVDAIARVAGVSEERAERHLKKLNELKLVARYSGQWIGYTLREMGYDIIALRTLVDRNVIEGIGSKIGIGKESDIFDAVTPKNDRVVIKFHRLGRISFRQVLRKRGYADPSHHPSWYKLSKIAARREYEALIRLFRAGVSVPKPIAYNRHAIVMGYIEGDPLVICKVLPNPSEILEAIVENVKRAYEVGIVHGDLSEYNIIITPSLKPLIIDWPQYVERGSEQSEKLLERDIRYVVRFFNKRFKLDVDAKELLNYVKRGS